MSLLLSDIIFHSIIIVLFFLKIIIVANTSVNITKYIIKIAFLIIQKLI